MTTVVCSKKAMAADTKVVDDGLLSVGSKIIEVNGDLIGVAGDLRDLYRFEKWYKVQDHDLEMEDSTILVLTKCGKIYTYDGGIRIPVMEKFYAIGSGAHAAMAAMHMGADPKKAIEIAKKVDDGTGGKVEVRER